MSKQFQSNVMAKSIQRGNYQIKKHKKQERFKPLMALVNSNNLLNVFKLNKSSKI